MTEKEILARLAEIQAALLRDHGRPDGLSERARRRAADLVILLKQDIKKRPPRMGRASV